eukprot:symbB.v1.2.001396.t1/scaffold75.1/size348941/2
MLNNMVSALCSDIEEGQMCVRPSTFRARDVSSLASSPPAFFFGPAEPGQSRGTVGRSLNAGCARAAMRHVFVRDLAGQTLTLQTDEQATVQSLKTQISEIQGVPVDEQNLIFAGRSLCSTESLSDVGLEEESTLFLSLDLEGGGKKRKKKTYTKPKKIKHKRKKVKLAVLKFYKVDSNDKVTRLRRECPDERCGPGVFMAMHFNRYYCGRCHLTYLIKKD